MRDVRAAAAMALVLLLLGGSALLIGARVEVACWGCLTTLAFVLTMSFVEANAARAEVDRHWLEQQRRRVEREREREEQGFE